MSRRRNQNEEAISLFPFMSILACLIGILTLMISVSMKTKNMDQKQGLTEEEVASAATHRELKARAAAVAGEIRKLEEQLQKGKKSSSELAGLEKRKSELAVELEKMSGIVASAGESQKAVARLKQEISVLKEERTELQNQSKNLQARLKTVMTPAKPVESVLVKPGGIGQLGNKKLFFIECNGEGIIVYENGKPTPPIATASIETSHAYGALLQRVKATRESMILFLIRKSGADSYRWAVGIAETKYDVLTGKLPIPNDGNIDLSLIR